MSTEPIVQEALPPPLTLGGASVSFPVVGIGTSAGGIQALRLFFQHMPSGAGMAFVVVIHLSPRHESTIDQILRGVTRMPVVQVNESTPIERDHVYVIPPNRHLLMRDGTLELAPMKRDHGSATSIDSFFRSLAAAHKEQAVAIVMSGAGSDGSVGVKNVKEHGGIIIVQAPTDAEYDSMPRSAIATGLADFVLPIPKIPERLLQLWQNIQQIRLRMPPQQDAPPEVAPRAYETPLRDVLHTLHSRTGHDFNLYKRGTVLRRLERRLQVCQLPDLAAYARYLRDNPAETRPLLKDMLISVTNFFRDREAFEALERIVIPDLFVGKSHVDEVRVWVPGCATGEEAYSIAMLLLEAAEARGSGPAIQVFASDIDEDAIAVARAGVFPAAIDADVSPVRLQRFFAREGDGYRVHKSVRERVMFAAHDLLSDAPFSRLDLVSCRNLLIYLNRDAQTRLLRLFQFALRPNAYLFLGGSESIDDASSSFVPVDKSSRIFRAQSSAGRPPPLLYGAPAVNASSRSGNPGGLRQGVGAGSGSSLGDLHLNLLEHYAPPSVVVDDLYQIIHLSDTAGRFLQFSAGEPSLNLVKVVQPEIRADLRAGLFQASQGTEPVVLHVLYEREHKSLRMTLTIHPVPDPASGRHYFLVVLDEQPAAAVGPTTARSDVSVPEQLEIELTRTREQLRNAVEQYETQNEELKASNEELQAINEELRSTTEELETSKEELQSLNEELSTVNDELKSRVDETNAVNDDLQNFIRSTDIGVLFVDRSLRVRRFTPPVRDAFNVLDGDLGRPLLDITHRLDFPQLQSDIEAVMSTLTPTERVVSGAPDRSYLVRVLPYRTAEHRIDGVVITLVDITSRREAEERVRRGEEWMRFVVDSVRDYAILTLDPEGRVNSWNTGAQRMFGYTPQEIVGQPGDLLFTPEDRATGAAQNEQARAREEGRAADERWHVRKDGSRFYCSGVMVPLKDGEFYGYVKVARDLTEQQQSLAERERLLSQERAGRAEVEQLNRQKDQFLAMLSHELRNPLNLILMQAQLLLRTDPFKDLKSRHTAEVIYQTAATQSRLVDDLLDVSRVMTGKLAMQQHLVPLPFIVGDSVGAVARDAEQKDVQLDIDLTPEPLIVQADPVRVRQIAWNLLTNAIKFTPSGGRVAVSLHRDGDEARLDVVDTGIGISAEALPHIFELFGQPDLSPARPQSGMGIGLALVRQLVDLHSGRIDVHSDGAGKGARFTVWLPLYVVPANEPRTSSVVETEPPGKRPTPEQGRLSLQGLHILVVDDAPDAVEAMHELLEMEGADVEVAVSGESALELAQTHGFDVVVSDIAMPGMDGIALIRRIRQLPDYGKAVAIACSGFNRRQDVQQALAAGFDAHLTKPIGLRDLIDAIVRLLPRHKG